MIVAGTTARDTILRVRELPEPDRAQRAEAIVDAPGGCGANVAYALSRLGHAPTLLTAVGHDFPGSAVKRRLDEAGIDLSRIVHEASEATARAVLTTEEGGRQTIAYRPGATPAMSRLEPVQASIGHFAPGELTAYPELMQACGTVTYDPGQETFQRPIEEVLAPLPHVDVLLVNEAELDRITEAVGELEALVDQLEALVVTDAEGQRVFTATERTRIEAAPADPVDLTGAGDAHSAGVVHGLAAGWPLPEACQLGSVLAAFAIERLGAQEGLPDREEALARYEEVYGPPPQG